MTPLVFVHGFMGGSRQWQPQQESLTGLDIVTLDLPGFGENAHLEAFSSISEFAQWALAELRAKGIGRFHLLGHSMGGMVAQEMVAQAPDSIERLVLYGTGAQGVLPGRFETIATSKQRASLDGPQATARRIAATWFLDREDSIGFEVSAAIAERSSMQAVLAGLDAMNDWSGTQHLADIKSKTLVIWGDNDRTYPWDQTEQLWQSIPRASLAVVPECAHAPHLEKPILFNSILTSFLAA